MILTGRWFPQIVDYKGQWESISNIYITKIVVLVSEPVCGRSCATELPCYPMLHCVANDMNRWEIFPSLLIGTSIS